MPKLTIQIPHGPGKEEATRLQQRFRPSNSDSGSTSATSRKSGTETRCSSVFARSLKISGQVESEAAGVKLSDLPMAAMMFRGTIEQQIRDELAEMLTG